MWSTVLGDLLPIAAAVALSPIPIIAVILVLDTPKARTVGPAFAVGWILGLTVVSSLVVLVAGGSSEPDSGADQTVNWAKVAIGVAFLVMAGRQWRKRPRADGAAEMPKWMASLDSITPGRGFLLGVALSAANPKNLALALAAGASIAQAGLDGIDTVIALAIFVVVGSITVAGAVVFAVVAPDAAARPLAVMKAFMTRHNALIMTVVLLVLGVKLLLDGLDGALR